MKNNAKQILNDTKSGKLGIGTLPKSELLDVASRIETKTTHLEFETKTTLHNGAKLVDEAYKSFEKALIQMNQQEAILVERTKLHVSKMKDMANQVATAIQRIEKITLGDFEKKLQQLERLATAVESLDKLNKSGSLAGIIQVIMSNKNSSI